GSVRRGQLVRVVGGVRTVVAEGGDGRHDQSRMLASEILADEAERDTPARGDVVDQYRRSSQKAGERIAALGAAEIQGDAALVGVQVEERAARLGIRLAFRKRTAASQRISLGRLDLDDVGAEIGENLSPERGRYALAVLDDPQTL